MANTVKFGDGVIFTAPIDLGAKKPLDSRNVCATLADRDAHVTNNRAYAGMIVYVEATKLSYVYSFDTAGNPAWLTLATSATSGITEEQARAIFTEMFTAAAKEGYVDDIRSYNSSDDFPMVEKFIASEGVAVAGKVYYTRSGASYPYTYTVADPQPAEGTSVVGYYELSGHLYTIKWETMNFERLTFPTVDTQYVDSTTMTEYLWKKKPEVGSTLPEWASGEYYMVNQTANSEDVGGLFS